MCDPFRDHLYFDFVDDMDGRCPISNVTGHEICLPLVLRQPCIEDIFASCESKLAFTYTPSKEYLPLGVYSGLETEPALI